MTVIDVGQPPTEAAEELAAAATAPARWLLEMASADGVPLTQTDADRVSPVTIASASPVATMQAANTFRS